MKIGRTELAAFILLGIGAALLVLTFCMAFMLIVAELNILSALDLSEALDNVLGPLAEAIIKVMYLGVMGWTGSIATMRGIQLIREAKRVPQPRTKPVQHLPSENEEKT